MLATLVDRAVHFPGWVYEEKYDGYRVLAYKEGAQVTLVSRTGKTCTTRFQGIADSIGRLRARTALLDGEAVAFDKSLVSRFQLLQKGEAPTVYAAFDCLWLDGRDLRDAALAERRTALERAIAGSDRIFAARRLPKDGLAAYRFAQRKGFEGLIAKDAAAPYQPGRSRRWLKVKIRQAEELVIGGFTNPGGTRSTSARCCSAPSPRTACTTSARSAPDSTRRRSRRCTPACGGSSAPRRPSSTRRA
jgi:bifunctional non-homologous end joining protein LigD